MNLELPCSPHYGQCECGMETKKLSPEPGHQMVYCPTHRFVLAVGGGDAQVLRDVLPIEYNRLVAAARAGIATDGVLDLLKKGD